MKYLYLLLIISFIFNSCSIFSCGYSDGKYYTYVYYYNPNTGYDADYWLDVEVEDCHVVNIIFPKGGNLDESHFEPAAIKKGEAHIVDDQDREFTVSMPQGNANDDQ